MATKLTDAIVKDLPAPPSGNRVTYDSEVAGFGVRVTKAGARAFIVNYRAGVRERRLTIGSYPDWTVKAARERAKELKREVDLGADPMAQRHAERAAPTVNDLCDRFEAEHLPKRRAATQEDYRSIMRLYIRPNLGKLRLGEVRHRDIEALHRKVAEQKPYRANRTVAVLSKMFSLAVKWDLVAANPAPGIERAPETKRERFLTPAEIARLAAVLDAHKDRARANVIRLLLLTGARRNEVLEAMWNQFNLESGVWTKQAATTKQAKLHRVPLSAPALALLTALRAEADTEDRRRAKEGQPPLAHLFAALDGKPLRDVNHFWTLVSKQAEITDCRIHDLRHTYASILASSGLSLPVIGALLGHTQAATTARYAHLLDDPLRAATERAGAIIMGAGKPGADVLPMPAGRGRRV